MGMRRSSWVVLPTVAVFCLLGSPAGLAAARGAPFPEAAAPASAAPGYAGSDTCATCHEDVANALKKTRHGQTGVGNWEGATGCESCHGPGAAHAAEGDKTKIRSPKLLSATQVSEICLACHERGDRSLWQGSPHEGRGLSCIACHRIHHTDAPPPKLLAKTTEFAT